MSLDTFQAVAGNSPIPEGMIGFEPVTRAARLVLLNNLNDHIDAQSDRWDSADLELQGLGLDAGVGQVDVEHVTPGNLYEGPHPSLMESPPEFFPNVSVMAYASVPSATFLDQIDSSDLTLFAETFVIAGPVPDGQEMAFETIVHRRIDRTTEAVHAAIKLSVNLLGTVNGIDRPPKGGIGNSSWLRRKEKGAGPKYIIHGSRLQYTLQRYADH